MDPVLERRCRVLAFANHDQRPVSSDTGIGGHGLDLRCCFAAEEVAPRGLALHGVAAEAILEVKCAACLQDIDAQLEAGRHRSLVGAGNDQVALAIGREEYGADPRHTLNGLIDGFALLQREVGEGLASVCLDNDSDAERLDQVGSDLLHLAA